MPIANHELLKPEFWASAFEMIEQGNYELQNHVTRKTELEGNKVGNKLNVPVANDPTPAGEWDGLSNASEQTQQVSEYEVVLNYIPYKKFSIAPIESSRSPYDLLNEFGKVNLEGLLLSVNDRIYRELLSGTNIIDGRSTFDEDTLTDVRTILARNKTGLDRKMFLSSGDMGVLLKTNAFKLALNSGTTDAQVEGRIGRKSGLDLYEFHSSETYTPTDLVGNSTNALAVNQTSMVVSNFVDNTRPIRVGDIFTVAGETGTPLHTVTGTTRDGSNNTINISFSPSIVSVVSANAVITVTPTRSILAFTRNSLALACTTLAPTLDGLGKISKVINMNGLPVRYTIWSGDNTGITVQMDCLIGMKAVRPERRIVRVLR